ncbi:AAA family ATPase [Pelagibacteraceae bacterium]|nr:AAA family ATPase [Pelagibacteraceae bacterium]
MTFPPYFNAKKSFKLFGLINDFNLLKKLYLANKLPHAIILSGNKGSGKSTLINHFLYYLFDKKNYDENNLELNVASDFHNQFINNIFPNIIYLNGSDYNNNKIEDIRNLKKIIYQTSISDKPRFIIFDDVELFNNNSLNSLLKIIEEPSKKNHFILIDNKSKPLLKTIHSRCLDFKIILNEDKRHDIIESLIKLFNLKVVIDKKESKLTPGSFIKFNYILDENKISLNEDFQQNLEYMLKLYKKEKNIIFIDMILFLTNNYFNNLNKKNIYSKEKIINNKNFVFENINKFFLYNLNQNALLSSIKNKMNDK